MRLFSFELVAFVQGAYPETEWNFNSFFEFKFLPAEKGEVLNGMICRKRGRKMEGGY